MIPELGHFALAVALALAIVQAVFPLLGVKFNKPQWVALAKPAATAQFFLLVISFGCLIYAFIVSDFSVKLVASHSNTAMPTIYKVSAVWGNHEGSLLLWALVLAGWGYAVAIFSRSIPAVMLARVLSVMGFVGIGFLLFLIMTSNPFERLPFPPAEGRTLNPLLQDFGLAIHPPMLYMGYVGFSVAFAFAIAAMLGGKLDSAWARWARPWTNVAWIFLTGGITLGSWWAYYELGWGGWWFWDPVENASLLPWLVGTALIHSLAVTEKRAAFKSWTVLLAILAFSLSLLGTFLVRSGVLTSVHSFAADPERGLFILMFLAITIGASLMLYATRAPKLISTGKFELVSREVGLLVNNITLVVLTATVLLGTLYPLIIDALGMGKISVGPPYFNNISLPLGTVLLTMMGVGLFLRWKKDNPKRLIKILWVPAIMALVMAVVLPLLFIPEFKWKTTLGLLLSSWVALTALLWFVGQGRSPFIKPLSAWGAMIAHVGMAVTITGITLTSMYSVENDVRLEANGKPYEVSDYAFKFIAIEDHQGKNYKATRATVEITQGGKLLTTLYPEKRNYGAGTMPMTEAGIDGGLFRDLFIALGEPLGKKAWSFRIYHKPFVRWIWLGGILMVVGGLLAAFDGRYWRTRRRLKSNTSESKKAETLKGATST
ncbi:MAG: heme lyase CcmF/NrfE family subunit [Cocleimonas sp.]|nr:heme lyase CcmF/NrfE family subunit [Cocleimonas sp.]